MATEESTVGWHTEEETRYTDPGSATSQSESFVSLRIPFPKTKSQKSKLKFFLVFVSPFLLIGLILLLNVSVKGLLNRIRNDTDAEEFNKLQNQTSKSDKSTAKAKSTSGRPKRQRAVTRVGILLGEVFYGFLGIMSVLRESRLVLTNI